MRRWPGRFFWIPLFVPDFHKAAIDLQCLDWKLVQGAERRVAGPEVIHGELDVEFIQLTQRFRNRLRVTHQSRLGNFELQELRVESRDHQQALDILDKIGLRIVLREIGSRSW